MLGSELWQIRVYDWYPSSKIVVFVDLPSRDQPMRPRIRTRQIKRNGAWAGLWNPTVSALGFLFMACSHPDGVARKPQDLQPQISTPAQDSNTRSVSEGKSPTPEITKSEKELGGSPALKGNVLIVPPSPNTAAAVEDSASSRTMLETPADRDSLDKVAESDKYKNEPAANGGKPIIAPPPPQSAAIGKDSGASKAVAENPVDQTTTNQTAKEGQNMHEPAKAGGNAAAPTPTVPIATAVKGSEGSGATDESPEVQEALAQVARKDEDGSVRMGAVAGLTRQTALAQIATTDKDPDVRKLAVSRLTIQAALAKVATSDEDGTVRGTAVALLTDQNVLARIASNDKDPDIRKRAVSLLTHQAALARIARHDMDGSVRIAAVNKLMDKAALAQIALSDPDPDIRKLAVSKLIHQTATPAPTKTNGTSEQPIPLVQP